MCACAESEADMLYLSRIRAATHAGCHRQRHRQQPGLASPRLASTLSRLWAGIGCGVHLLAGTRFTWMEHGKFVKINNTHFRRHFMDSSCLADVTLATCHTPHTSCPTTAPHLPTSFLSFVAGGQLIQRPRSPSVIADTGAH